MTMGNGFKPPRRTVSMASGTKSDLESAFIVQCTRTRRPLRWPRTKSDLEVAFIMVKCSQKVHDDCRGIRDVLIDQSRGRVQKAYTTNAVIEGTRWCVAASALVRTDQARDFERQISQMRTRGRHPVRVTDVMFILNQLHP